MEQGAVEELEEAQRETRTELLRIVQEDPNLLDEAERLEQFMSLADENMEHVLDEFLEKGDLTTGALVYFTDLSSTRRNRSSICTNRPRCGHSLRTLANESP